MKILDSETAAKILFHKRQIDALYKEAKKRPSNMVCDICGHGDFTNKVGTVFKVKDRIHGYIHRGNESPKLCFRHFGGWSISHDWYNPFNKRSDQEIDLHFAEYLAKQLMKEKHATNKPSQPA